MAIMVVTIFSVNSYAQSATRKSVVMSYDPVIARADIVFYDTSISGLIPTIVRAHNGDLIVCAHTRGDVMPTSKSKDYNNNFVRSSDLGKTWQRYMTSKAENRLSGLAEYLFDLPGGRILRYSLEAVWPSEPDQAKLSWSGKIGQ